MRNTNFKPETHPEGCMCDLCRNARDQLMGDHTISAQVKEYVKEQLKEEAERRGVSQSTIIRELVAESDWFTRQ